VHAGSPGGGRPTTENAKKANTKKGNSPPRETCAPTKEKSAAYGGRTTRVEPADTPIIEKDLTLSPRRGKVKQSQRHDKVYYGEYRGDSSNNMCDAVEGF